MANWIIDPIHLKMLNNSGIKQHNADWRHEDSQNKEKKNRPYSV